MGEISGHSKAINSIDFKQTRPYRVATAGEDTESAFFAGPPFKYQHSNKVCIAPSFSLIALVRSSSPRNQTYCVSLLARYDCGLSPDHKSSASLLTCCLRRTPPQDHTRFVQCVRFAPDGSVYVTASSDGKVWHFCVRHGQVAYPVAVE